MRVVVDASAVIAVIADEPSKAMLVTQTVDCDLIAPGSLPWEVGNALSAMFKRKRISKEQADDAIAAYRAIPITLLEVDLSIAVELAHRLEIYAYDAYVIACASVSDCALLSLDRNLVLAAKRAGVETWEFGHDDANGV